MTFTEIMERIVGPIFFVVGITLLIYQITQQTSFLTDAKTVYMEDSVYSQGSSNDSVENQTVDRDGILSEMMCNTTATIHVVGVDKTEIMIEYGKSGMWVRVSALGNTPNRNVLVFNSTITTLDDFPLQYLHAGNYTVKYYYSGDELSKILYTEINGGN